MKRLVISNEALERIRNKKDIFTGECALKDWDGKVLLALDCDSFYIVDVFISNDIVEIHNITVVKDDCMIVETEDSPTIIIDEKNKETFFTIETIIASLMRSSSE